MKILFPVSKAILSDEETVTYRNLLLWLLLVFLLLLLWRPWTGNEENYFQLAFRTFSPNAFPEYHAAFDKASGRFIVEYLIGTLISSFGYDSAHLILRATQAIIYATGFAILFKALRFSPLNAIAAIGIVILSGEQFYGGEWLFKGVEAKTLCYGITVAALGIGLHSKWLLATILLAIATWIHFLVGGFWMIALAVLRFLYTKQLAPSFRLIAIYSALVLPLALIISFEQYVAALPPDAISPAEIYAQRNVHHIAPFYGSISEWQFWRWADGIAAAGLILFAFIIYLPKAQNTILLKFVIFLLAYLLIALMFSFIDRNTFLFSKFYLFRPSSLTLLLTVIVVLAELKHFTSPRIVLFRQLSLIVFVLLFTLGETMKLARYVHSPQQPDFSNLIDAIEQNSDPEEIILTQPQPGSFTELDMFLPRQLNRPTLVSWKFAPTSPPLLIKWHELIEKRKSIFAGDCDAFSEYPVKLLIVTEQKALTATQACGKVVWHDANYHLVDLRD
jgi:hypothetical protein